MAEETAARPKRLEIDAETVKGSGRGVRCLYLTLDRTTMMTVPISKSGIQAIGPARRYTGSGILALMLLFGGYSETYGQEAEPAYERLVLDRLEPFRDPPENWSLAGGLFMDLYSERVLEVEPGAGILVNRRTGGSPEDLFTIWEHGDIDLELSFMMAKGSNSGIYFQSRYELQLLDSWGVKQPRFGDMGGIYEWRDESGGGGGIPPRVNAARAPGLWQHLRVRFRAPRFNQEGEKIAHARFEEVILNGEMIHRSVEVDRPTGGTVSGEEVEMAPLRIQGTHGPVAFRHIRYREPDRSDHRERHEQTAVRPEGIPMRIEIGEEPLVLHGFMDIGRNRHTHTAAVAFPERVHYALDQNSGALLKLWKGDFVDASTIWAGRGGNALSLNEEAAIQLTAAPSLAYLQEGRAAWPDTLQQDVTFRLDHYRLDGEGGVNWKYRFDRLDIEDRFAATDGGRELKRELRFRSDKTDERLHFRIVQGESISWLPNGLIQINDHQFYIRLCESGAASSWIRESESGQELVLRPAEAEEFAFTYSYIW